MIQQGSGVILKFNFIRKTLQQILNPMERIVMLFLMLVNTALCEVIKQTEEFCHNEIFRPQCMKNDVILMKSATYGRMNVGRCLAAAEVDAIKTRVGDDPSYFGCSVDVLDIIDKNCSGKTGCHVPVIDIAENNMKPCFPGLSVYLQASYDCLPIVDERHSCIIKALMNPIYIVNSSPSQRKCGTTSQPWIVESPAGLKIHVTLIHFNIKGTTTNNKHQCINYGTISDKAGNRNVSICGIRGERQRTLHVSTGNTLEIYLTSLLFGENDDESRQFLLHLEVIGCSDIVPPEDTWLKRKDDAVIIGCYSTRQTWQLSCNEGKWIGVLGNCSANKQPDQNKDGAESEVKSAISDQEQILAIVAITGCTFAVCLIIICVGAVCLRRFYFRYKSHHDSKTLGGSQDPNQHLIRGIPPDAAAEYMETEEGNFDPRLLPTYSVYAGDSEKCNSLIGHIVPSQ